MVQYAELENMDQYNHINIARIKRDFNIGADDLAKQGSSKHKLVAGWI